MEIVQPAGIAAVLTANMDRCHYSSDTFGTMKNNISKDDSKEKNVMVKSINIRG